MFLFCRLGPGAVHLVLEGTPVCWVQRLLVITSAAWGVPCSFPQHSCFTTCRVASYLFPFLHQRATVDEPCMDPCESADALHTLTVRRQLEEHSISRASSTQLPIPHSAYAYHGRKPAKHIKDRVGGCGVWVWVCRWISGGGELWVSASDV
eukprot:scaffold40589_cov18-Tisochrysis_lutea.AAC.4